VATVHDGGRPVAVQRTPGSSLVPSAPLAPNGDESAESRRTASNGGAKARPAPRGITYPRPAPTAPPGDGSSGPAPAAGEFAPDPAPAESAATKPERSARAIRSQPAGGGEFSP
jgi:hypothetical protein